MNFCIHCGIKTKNPKFCSSSCSAIYNNTGKKRSKKIEKTCINCGNTCNVLNKEFCSQQCFIEHKKRKNNLKNTEIIESNKPIRWKLMREYLLERQGCCSECGIKQSWNNKPLSLQCDHIDGDVTNNILSNARLLCPNCHSQTHTYGSKNKNNPNGKDARNKRLRYHR